MTKNEIVNYLNAGQDEELFDRAAKVKTQTVGAKVYLRALIELSNVCACDCLYCGLRKSNDKVVRYTLDNQQIEESIKYAIENKYGSVVIQSGEVISQKFTEQIEKIVTQTQNLSNGKLAVTLSCGQQSEQTYRRWFDKGASRYLLRIETSSRELFKKIHPPNIKFDNRIEALQTLQKIGFQTGSGVMIGLPNQTIENLADDLLWLRKIDVDMCGMGPYIPHQQTPLYGKQRAFDQNQTVVLTLRMIALLRILMPDINIAATTALATLDPIARAKAIQVGANVIMPNVTPPNQRSYYNLYDNKATDLDVSQFEIAYNEQGTSQRYQAKCELNHPQK